MQFEQFRYLIPGWLDILEIMIVAWFFYRVLMFLVGTRAFQILLGLVSIGLVYLVAVQLNFNMVTTLLGFVFTYGVFAAIVVFQPELRQVLARLGRTRAIQFLAGETRSAVADAVADAAERLSRRGTGAIIAIEREVSLSGLVETGTELHATVSADLLTTIFTPYSPLHDGAVLIRGDSVIGAGCVLPLTQSPISDRSLGTRHRAALGLSEETDAIVIVVSEETAQITIALHGVFHRDVTPKQVRELMDGPEKPELAPAGDPSEASSL
jgi:diadenylate cyclase